MRLDEDRGKRTDENSLFHYKMDICLTLFYARDKQSKTLLVSPSGKVISACRTDDEVLGRSPYVPLFAKNVTSLMQGGYCKWPAARKLNQAR